MNSIKSPGNLPIIFQYRWLWHVLFWIAVYGGYTISYGGYGDLNYLHEAHVNAGLLPIRIIFTYLFIYLLIPRLLLKKKYKAFALATIIHAIVMGFCIWMFYYFVYYLPGLSESSNESDKLPVFYAGKIFVSIISNYAIPLSAATIKLFKWWYLDQQYKVQLEKDRLASELKYLKAQVHPHFLFNTLNNLYALTLKKSPNAPDIVLKLSSLLDYMLYHTNAKYVLLEKEINILENYLDLEKLRYGDRLELNYNVIGDISGYNIAPLTLFPFIENAFKHGASKDSTAPKINITIITEKEQLILKVANSINNNKVAETGESNGLGLKNIKRQLDLVYPHNHNLDITANHNNFAIELTLKCKGINEDKMFNC